MKAVLYCRVSTDEYCQLNALDDQVQEAKNCIFSMGWELVDNYIDEGKSGTSIKKRNEYRRLFDDLSTSKFDVLVIKSQDRLMRNVKEWYMFVDALVSNKKQLYFYLDKKFYTPDDALITGIKAILAEEYSRDLSKKIRNAHKNRQETGKSVLITSATWGYDKIDKKVVINDKEAKVVQLIFDLCIQGYGSRSISKELSNRGILSRNGGHFPDVTVRRIIRNPLFKGTVIMNKKSVDFHTKKTIINPEEDWKIHDSAVPPIVSSELWHEANRIMDSRSQKVKTQDFKTRMTGKNKGKYGLSGKILCGLCDSPYWRRYRRGYKNKDKIIVDWSCAEYVKRGRRKNDVNSGCNNIHIKETDLLNFLSEIAKSILLDKKEQIIKYAMDIIKDVLGEENIQEEKRSLEKEKEKIIRQKNTLLDKLLDETITDVDYKRRNSELENKLADIRKAISLRGETSVDINDRLPDIKSTLDSSNLDEMNAFKLIKRITKIVVHTDKLDMYFDFCEKITVNVTKNSKRLYADTDKYLTTINNHIPKPFFSN